MLKRKGGKLEFLQNWEIFSMVLFFKKDNECSGQEGHGDPRAVGGSDALSPGELLLEQSCGSRCP